MRFVASIFFILFCSLCISNQVYADSVNVRLNVAICNSNLICEEIIGENYNYCPSDCEAPPSLPNPGIPSGSGGPTGGYTITNSRQFPGTPTSTPINPGAGIGLTDKDNLNKSIAKNPFTVPEASIIGPISIAPFDDRANLNFTTGLPTLANISWGETATYELGSSADSWYYQNHTKIISGLKPGTRYYYRLQLVDTIGRISDYEGSFITSSSNVAAKLPVVTDFLILTSSRRGEVLLSWDIKAVYESVSRNYEEKIMQSASVSDAERELLNKKIRVRLTRSEFGYPKHPLEGKVIYEGSGQQVTDAELISGVTYYYSIFVMDKENQNSAPAGIKLTYEFSEEGDTDGIYDPLLQDGYPFFVDPDNESRNQEGFCEFGRDSGLEDMNLQNLYDGFLSFIHNKQTLPKSNNIVEVRGSGDLIIRANGQEFGPDDQAGLCLLSQESGASVFYIMPRNADDNFELVFPSLYEIFRGKKGYDFSFGMLKYKGEKVVLEKGKILFFLRTETETFPWLKVSFLGFVIITLTWWFIKKIRSLRYRG